MSEPDRPTDTQVTILPLTHDYIPLALTAYHIGYRIQPREYDHPEVMTAEKFAQQLDIFPEGVFMAYDALNDRVVGLAVAMRFDFDPSRPYTQPWAKTTDYGRLTTHNPNGEWLYGVDNVVLAEYRGQGIGGRLMRARYQIAQRYNLRGMVAGSMIIDYHKVADHVPVEEYVADVVAGRRWDTNLSKQLKKGMQVHSIIPDFLSDEPNSCNYGVTIVWHNPNYRPTTVTRTPAKRPAIRQTPLSPDGGR